MIICFKVNGQPQGKARPRFSRKSGTVYTPKTTLDYEAQIRKEYMKAGGTKQKAPCCVNVWAGYKIPKSWSRMKVMDAVNGGIVPGKPDVDNVLKVVLDALNGVAYEDDKQVISAYCSKAFAPIGEEPSIRVRVSFLGVKGE